MVYILTLLALWMDGLLQEYINSDALIPNSNKPTANIGIKLVLNNTPFYKSGLEAAYLSLMDVDNYQSSRHQVIAAVAMVKETNFNLRQMATAANLYQLFSYLTTVELEINGHLYPLFGYLTSDWITMCNELGIPEPAHASDNDI